MWSVNIYENLNTRGTSEIYVTNMESRADILLHISFQWAVVLVSVGF